MSNLMHWRLSVQQARLFDYLHIFADGHPKGNETSRILKEYRYNGFLRSEIFIPDNVSPHKVFIGGGNTSSRTKACQFGALGKGDALYIALSIAESYSRNPLNCFSATNHQPMFYKELRHYPEVEVNY